MKIRISIKKRNWKKAVLKRLIWLSIGIIILELVLRSSGSVYSYLQESKNKNTKDVINATKNVYRILTLGESTTGDCVGNFAWPRQLQEILNNRSREIKFKVFNEGVCGTNTAFILSRLEENLDNYNPDIVIAMIGANDKELHIKYEETPVVKIFLLLEDLRVYKLSRLLWSAWMNKLKNYRVIKFVSTGYIKKKSIIYNKYLKYEKEEIYNDMRELGKTEDMLKKEIEINPENYNAYSKLINLYKIKGEFAQVENMLKKEIEINPENYNAYFELVRIYADVKEYTKAKEVIEKATEINLEDDARIKLAMTYLDIGEYAKAKEVIEEVEINPKIDLNRKELAHMFINFGEYAKAKEVIERAVEINPRSDWAYIELSRIFHNIKEYVKEEYMLEKAIEINPENYLAYSLLAENYRNRREHAKAENILKKAGFPFKVVSDNSGITSYHYIKLYDIVSSQGIKLIAMQYPTLDVEEIKQMFNGNEGIIFVSNEDNFREALKNGEYRDYFTDKFGETFGHATEKGNKLIAESVANVILKELGVNA